MDTPVASLRERMWNWFERHAKRPHALGWLAFVAFTDAVVSPLVPEVFLAALMLAHPNRWKQYLSVAILSTTLGAAVGYFIAGFLFIQFGEPILAFYGLNSAFETARHLIMGHVFITMAVASFTPIPDKVFIYAGGFLGVHFVPFIAGYTLGRGVRMALVTYLAGHFGKHALDLINRYLLWAGAALVILATIYAMVHWHLFDLWAPVVKWI
jgi:membrane protein YqaA with SNARE-associated domain